MDESVTLFESKSDTVNIYITARFEDENLMIEGQDIGKTVEDFWGDSDYEYGVTVKKENIGSLCKAMGIDTSDNQLILLEIAKKFKGNECYSKFRKFLEKHNIDSEGFSWS